MHTLSDMMKALNRRAVVLHGLQARFELPAMEGAGYSEAYLAFLRTVVFLRMLNVSEELLREAWCLEKKLLQILKLDLNDSQTWFLDSCAETTHKSRRLLLTNHDLGFELPSRTLQLGLNFDTESPELFAGKEMGEDALRVLSEYLKLHKRIQESVSAELPLVKQTTIWSRRLRL